MAIEFDGAVTDRRMWITNQTRTRIAISLHEGGEEIGAILIDFAKHLHPTMDILVRRVDEAKTGPVEVSVR